MRCSRALRLGTIGHEEGPPDEEREGRHRVARKNAVTLPAAPVVTRRSRGRPAQGDLRNYSKAAPRLLTLATDPAGGFRVGRIAAAPPKTHAWRWRSEEHEA